MAVAGEIAVNIVARTRGYTGGLNRAKGITAGFGGAVRRALGPLNSFAGRLAGLAGLSFGLTGAIRTLTSAFRRLDDVAKVSDRLGLSIDQLVGLRNAAELSGVGISTLDMALQRMTKRIGQAKEGTGEAIKAFQYLGVTAQELSRLTPYEAFLKLSDAMERVPSSFTRVSLAAAIFDSEGVKLVNTLAMGSTELEKIRREAISTGQAVSREMAAKIEAAKDSFTRLWQSTRGLGNMLAVRLAPVVQYVGEQLTNFAKWTGNVSLASVKMTAKILAATIAFTGALLIIPKIIRLAVSLVKGLRSIALGLSTVQALGGPAGWATLTVGLGVAVTAAIAVDKAFDKIEAGGKQAVASANAGLKTTKNEMGGLAEKIAEAEDKWRKLNDEAAETPGHIADAAATEKRARDTVKRQQFTGAAAFGTTEAFSAIVQARAQQQRQIAIEKQQLNQQVNGNKSLEEIAHHTQEMAAGMGVLYVQDLRS